MSAEHEASDRPPSRLPDGRSNAAYYRWRRKNGLSDPRKWNNSKAGREAIAQFRKRKEERERNRIYNSRRETPEQYADRIMKGLRNVDLY